MNRARNSKPQKTSKCRRAKINVNRRRFAKRNEQKNKSDTKRKQCSWKDTERDRDRLCTVIPACSPSFSSSYLIDSDREFTAKSMLTRKSLWKCSWGPEAYTLNHTGTHTHTLSTCPTLGTLLTLKGCHWIFVQYTPSHKRDINAHTGGTNVKSLTIYQKQGCTEPISHLPYTVTKTTVRSTRGALYGWSKQLLRKYVFPLYKSTLSRQVKQGLGIKTKTRHISIQAGQVLLRVLAGKPAVHETGWSRVEQTKITQRQQAISQAWRPPGTKNW